MSEESQVNPTSLTELQTRLSKFLDWYALEALRLCDKDGEYYRAASDERVVDFTKSHDRGKSTPLMITCQNVAFNLLAVELDGRLDLDGSVTDLIAYAPSEKATLSELDYYIRHWYSQQSPSFKLPPEK